MAHPGSYINDLLRASRQWQLAVLAEPTPEASDKRGIVANRELSKHPGASRSQRVILKAAAAFMLPDGLREPYEETIWPALQFGSLTVTADLARPVYVRTGERGLITWPLHDATVHTSQDFLISPDGDPDQGVGYYLPTVGIVPRTLYAPVFLIDYALSAA